MTKDKTEPVPPGASPGYQIKERFPTPESLPEVPEAGTMSAEERSKRVLLNFAKVARGMANTAPQRGDAMGPTWHELACDLQAQCEESGLMEKPKRAEAALLELRPLASVPVQSMLHTAPADQMQTAILTQLGQQGAILQALAEKLAALEPKK